jgi:hypothetical protein
MPAQPSWLSHFDSIRAAVRALPRPFVDRATVQALLGVGRRRAQQILAPCVTERVGANGLAAREAFLRRLDEIAAGEEARGEVERRRRVARTLTRWRAERLRQPPLPVEAPVAIVNQQWASLPAGVRLEPGRLTVEFEKPQEALEKLLALAMAISNDWAEFERRAERNEETGSEGRGPQKSKAYQTVRNAPSG